MLTKYFWLLISFDAQFGLIFLKKPPSGVLEGSLLWLGNYFECTNITQSDWNGKYCYLNLVKESSNCIFLMFTSSKFLKIKGILEIWHVYS